MTQSIEKATFENTTLKNPRNGKFETVDAPVLSVQACLAPFGAELDTIYSPLPKFAGRADPRKHLTLQLEIQEEAAEGFRRLDAACMEHSKLAGAWSPWYRQ